MSTTTEQPQPAGLTLHGLPGIIISPELIANYVLANLVRLRTCHLSLGQSSILIAGARKAKPLSVGQLATMTGFAEKNISQAVRSCIEGGYLCEVGTIRVAAGKGQKGEAAKGYQITGRGMETVKYLLGITNQRP